MITRKKKADDFATPDNMFEPPVAEVFEDDDNKGKASDQDDRYDNLAKQIAELQAQNAEFQRANMALLATPQSFNNSDTFTPADPNKISLPDPALDPDGYDKALADRQQIRADNARRKDETDRRRASEVEEKVEDLWQSFGDKYPDMADDKDKIDFVSTNLAKRAAKRGVDVQRYMFVTRDKFLDDVAAEYVKVFGEPEGNDEEDFEDRSNTRRSEARAAPRRRASSRDRSSDEHVGRTAGVFGGTESGGRPSRGRDADDESGPSMIDDIQALQRKTGFF